MRIALEEDTAQGDATTAALFSKPIHARGTIMAQAPVVIAGIVVAREVFVQLDPDIRVVDAVADGTSIDKRALVMTVEGDARSLLAAERVALNFLQHLSGIATLTAKFCATVRGYKTKILDTRKTVPGLRCLEKWAVRLGGGYNHRHSLGDGILIKDNHLMLLKAQRLSLAHGCRLARDLGPHGLRVMAEAQSLNHVRDALQGQADVILLDNMTLAQVRDAVAMIKGRALVEVSGGITLTTAPEMAAAGADYLSVGSLTHSAPAADLSMDIMAAEARRSRRS